MTAFKGSKTAENLTKAFAAESPVAPPKCPVCAHPQAYFEMFVENY